ncbi:MAG: transposase [Candidatus Obscuribacter sp.]|nr:transposase [Candidatus Obscuribacter sp.]
MTRQLEHFKARRLDNTDIAVVFIDGVGLADRLFVTALKAIREVFGNSVAVQRCTEHKRRNVKEKLPKHAQSNFSQKFSAAINKKTCKAAQNALARLKSDLELKGYKSAVSL